MINISTSKLSYILYVIAALIILVPIAIVLVTDIHFSSMFSKISLSTVLTFIILVKTLTVLKKFKMNKKDKSIPMNIGVIIGFLTILVYNIFK